MRPAAAAAVAALLVAACAGPGGPREGPAPRADPQQAACEALFAKIDAAVGDAGVSDAMATRIAGFPHLRTDRLLASFRNEAVGAEATAFWLGRLGTLDADARAVELANLPPAARAALAAAPASPGTSAEGGLDEALAGCRDTLAAADLADDARLAALRDRAVVPDDYRVALRALGLYPLTRLPFAAGVRAFEREIAATFALPLDALAAEGALRRYAPPPAAPTPREALARRVRASAANPLGLPLPDAATLRALALAHAPVLEIDVAGDDDLPGMPHWPARGPAAVDPAQPALFFRAAHTRVGSRVLLQLVYTAWFPARPSRGAFDLLAGRLDGLVWRVTLDEDARPVVFDSMHPCGCYHFFFPTGRARLRPATGTLEEWRFVPQTLPRPRDGERVVLRVAARTHYLQRVRYELRSPAGDAIPYALHDDDLLRRLPLADGGGTRSLYAPDGFVRGSERRERFVYWPMGIENPGAMRQWGRHATAFVGRRHFDDARLIDERFELVE